MTNSINNLLDNIFYYSSLANKKSKLKILLIQFIQNTYTYLSSCSGEQDRLNTGINIEILYEDYIKIINHLLSLNQEEINKSYINLCIYIIEDYINYSLINEETSFIYNNDKQQANLLKKVLIEIFKYSKSEDYFTFKEFKEYFAKYKTCYLNIKAIDIYNCIGKIPKRLKEKPIDNYKKYLKG